MNISDKNEYIRLKDTLTFSEFQMYIFLRVQNCINAYMSRGIQFTRMLITPYVYDMNWYNAYVAHVQAGKEIWKE